MSVAAAQLKNKEEATCRREIAAEVATCEEAKRALRVNATSCGLRQRGSDRSRLGLLEQQVAEAVRARGLAGEERKQLRDQLEECRSVEMEGEKVMQHLVVVVLVLVVLVLMLGLGLVAAMVILICFQNESGTLVLG